MKTVNLSVFKKMKGDSEKISCLTAYDASFAQLFTAAGVDMLMVGDSLGMVVQGRDSTVPVTLENIIYHCKNVRRGCMGSQFVIADMPFMSYHKSDQALINGSRLLQEAKANMVKMEGGVRLTETIKALSDNGIPVCAHLGLLPQSVNKIGGFRVQGNTVKAAQLILKDAQVLQESGADMLVLECVPAALGKQISARLAIPVIGIGAGPDCDGQVLVCYDMLGITQTPLPRFVKNFMADAGGMDAAVKSFVEAVKAGTFPAPEHCYA